MHIGYDSGAVLDFQMVPGDSPETLKPIVSAESVPSIPSTPCDVRSGCAIGVQVRLEGQ
ncbi:hypothetical protein NK8_82690 (plasmid) [Caballeronia sp. NK8]|nr:hypothetical protein NK8_82690 [Caballeronia sp. NK8]